MNSPLAAHIVVRLHVEASAAQVVARGIDIEFVRPPLCEGFVGRAADEVVRGLPLLFSICAEAQACAARLALAAARGQAHAPHRDDAVAREAVREHLWRLWLDLPPVLGLPARPDLLRRAMRALAGSGPAAWEALLDDALWSDLWSRLDAASACLTLPPTRCLPSFDATASLALWPRLDAAFAAAPHWRGAAAECGALGRRAARASPAEHDVAARWRARHEEVGDWAAGRAKLGAGGTASSVTVAPGVGRAVVETARGPLLHEIRLDDERVAEYVMVAPTDWNFAAPGVLGAWLGGQRADALAMLRERAALLVATLDPCLPWRIEMSEFATGASA